VEALERAGYEVKGRLSIDQEATVVEDRHQQEEGRISTGSTKKGVGAARAARAMRKARRMVDFEPAGYTLTDTTQLLRDSEQEVIIEGVQGYGLGSHAGYYPFCTSSDCRASDFLAMAGLPPQECEVWVVLRVYPIRIAGNSGPLRGETSWQQLGLEPEITTVTRKIRRVGEWDLELAREAIAANGGPKVRLALMTADYKWPELKRKIENDPIRIEILDEIEEIEDQLGARIEMIGTSPSTQILLDYARLAT
jgi:adenylosuccinate synthase